MSQIEVILWKRIPNLGTVGDRAMVKAGYARNYLIPEGLASRVTEENIKLFEAKRAELESLENDLLAEAKNRAAKIKDVMENAVDLEVPNKVDYESGPNWGEIK